MQKLEIPKRDDEKYRSINDIVKSPVRSPSKFRNVQTIQTGLTEIKIECRNSKKSLKTEQFFGNLESEVFCIKFDDEDTMVAAATTDGTISVYSLINGNHIKDLAGSDTYTPTTCLKWRPMVLPSKNKGVLVAGNADGTITQWQASTGKLLAKIQEPDNQILALDYTVSGQNFASAGQDFKIRVYDEATKALKTVYSKGPYQMPGHSNRIFALRFCNDDPNILLSGGWDSCVFIWDLREKNAVGCIPGPNISGEALDFKNNIILTGSHREVEALELWDFGTRKRIREISWNQKENDEVALIYACQFSKVMKEYIIAGSSGQNEVKIFDRDDDCKEIAKVLGLKKGCYSVEWGNCTRKVAFSGGDGIIYVCNLGS